MVCASVNSSSLSAEEDGHQCPNRDAQGQIVGEGGVCVVGRRPHLRCPPPSWPSSGRWLSPGSAETPAGRARSRQTSGGSGGRILRANRHSA